MDMKLELVVLPVTDVDRAKAFYEQAGFDADVDHQAGDDFRVVQLTPPGSECSITIGKGITVAPERRQGLHLVVTDIEAADELVGRRHRGRRVFHFGPRARRRASHPEHEDYGSFATFSDPDGNGWAAPGGPSRRLAGMTGAVELDEPAFDALAQRHRRELHVHCYRMLASFDEAEDAVQETFLRAWRSRDALDGDRCSGPGCTGSPPTSASTCSGAVARVGRAPARSPRCRGCSRTPIRCSTRCAADDEPDAVVVARETIELAFLAALQVLPPRQRAALIARDVLGWPAAETADAPRHERGRGQQRAAAGAGDDAGAPARPALEWSAPASRATEERVLLERFIDAHERCDAAAAVAIAAEDIRITMPPTRCASTAWTPSRRCCAGLRPRARRRLAARARRGQPHARRRRATCAAPATRCSGPSSSTSCGSRTARSRRSRPSATATFPASACPTSSPTFWLSHVALGRDMRQPEPQRAALILTQSGSGPTESDGFGRPAEATDVLGRVVGGGARLRGLARTGHRPAGHRHGGDRRRPPPRCRAPGRHRPLPAGLAASSCPPVGAAPSSTE